MSIEIILLLAVCTVAAFLLTASRIKGFWFLVKHSTVVDIVFTIGALIVFAGTLGGTLVGVLAGLIMALFLSCMKRFKGTIDNMQPRDSEFTADGKWKYNQAPYV